MREISKEFNEQLKEWSEGNEYLYSLLYIAWEHGIRTHACCGGHEDHKENCVYVSFIVDEETLPYFESMIGAMEKIPNVSLRSSYRYVDYIKEEDRVNFNVKCDMYNRMDTFYRLADAILKKHKIETPEGAKLFENIKRLLHCDREELHKTLDDGVTVDYVLATTTPEYIEYIRAKEKWLYKLRQLLKSNKTFNKYDFVQQEAEEKPTIKL